MKKPLFLFSVSAALLVSACSTTKAPEIDYQSTMGKENLEVPPDLTSPAARNQYALPAGSGSVRASELAQLQGTNARGTKQEVLPQIKGMHIERDGNQRWLVLDSLPPEKVWPKLQLFWQKTGFTIARQDPAIGYMETDWAENRAKLPNDGLRALFEKVGLGNVYATDERDKFIARIERNKSGGTDVFFSHRGMKEVYTNASKDTTVWQPRQSSSALEAVLLGKFMEDLGASGKQVDKELGDLKSGSSEFAKLENGQLSVLGRDHGRNRQRIGLALDRVGLAVAGVNESNGSFLVQPVSEESDSVRNAKPGLFGRLFGSSKPTERTQKPKLIVKVTPAQNGDVVSLYTQDGAPLGGAEARDYLQRLYIELR